MRKRSTVCHSVELGLRCLGLWPGLSCAAVNFTLYILSLLLIQYFLYAYVVLHFDAQRISHLIDCLSFALAYSQLTVKLVNLWLKRRALHEMLDTIDEDWKEASNIASSMTVMLRKADQSRTYSNFLIGLNVLTSILYVIGSYVVQQMSNTNGTREFPVRMEFPFDISASPTFELTMLAQFIHETTVAILMALSNALLLTLILHVSGQIDIVCENIRQITVQSFRSRNTVRKFVCDHQKIINFIDNINDLYSFIALLEFICNTIVICCIGFAIVASIGTEDVLPMLTRSATFYMAITLEAFVYCYSGEYLTAKSKSIGDAAYESLWYDLKPRECRVLLIIIMRSLKRLTITAGSFMDLSLETFTSIMKASASYASVLHAMY